MSLQPFVHFAREPIDGADHPVEVVFIGDNQELAEMYRLKLQLDGYGVTLVTTEQAKSDFREIRTPDIVYLDIGPPDAAGLAIHQMLRTQRPTKYLPIVLLLTQLARERFSTGLKLGIHDFVISSDAMRPQAFWSEYRGERFTKH